MPRSPSPTQTCDADAESLGTSNPQEWLIGYPSAAPDARFAPIAASLLGILAMGAATPACSASRAPTPVPQDASTTAEGDGAARAPAPSPTHSPDPVPSPSGWRSVVGAGGTFGQTFDDAAW